MSKTPGWQLNNDSSSVLVVWFKDGNIRTFYSIDWRHRLSKSKDAELGLSRLRKLVAKYGNRAGNTFISKNDSPDPRLRTLLEHYYEGVPKEVTSQTREALKTLLPE